MIRALLAAALLLPSIATAQTTLYPTGGAANSTGVFLTSGRGGSALSLTWAGAVCDGQPAGDRAVSQTWGDYGPIGPITLNQAITFNVRGKEGSGLANLAPRCRAYYVYGGSSYELCTTAPGTEWGNTESARSVSCTPNVAVPNNSYIRVNCWSETVATVGGLDQCFDSVHYWNGPTAGASGDSYVTFTQTLPPQAPAATPATGATIAWNRTEPIRELGGTITFTATGSGATVDGLAAPQAYYEFRFWRYRASTGWVMMRDWSSSPTYVHTPIVVGEDEGWGAWARMIYAAGDGYGLNEIHFTTLPSPITSSTLVPSKTSGATYATELVTWTATGVGVYSGGSPLPQSGYEFRFFWFHDGAWETVQEWSSVPTWTWTAVAGSYDFAVHTRVASEPTNINYGVAQTFTTLSGVPAATFPSITCQ